jgi:GST-like protein
MLELLGMSSPNVQKVQMMLDELGAPYRLTRVDVWKGENFTPEFIAEIDRLVSAKEAEVLAV